jgi:hypothetical protein
VVNSVVRVVRVVEYDKGRICGGIEMYGIEGYDKGHGSKKVGKEGSKKCRGKGKRKE